MSARSMMFGVALLIMAVLLSGCPTQTGFMRPANAPSDQDVRYERDQQYYEVYDRELGVWLNAQYNKEIGRYELTDKGREERLRVIKIRKEEQSKCCFLPETEVVMADGSLKDISRIREGDVVRSYNAEKGTTEARMVLKTYTVVRDGYYLINGSIKATSTHRFLMAEEREVWKMAKELRPGDRIRSIGGDVAVKSIERVAGLNVTHNFRIALNHSFIVKGAGKLYVVHNGI